MILRSIRYLGMNDVTAIEELTPREYRLLHTGASLRMLDNINDQHRLAWLTREIEATEGKGKSRKYVYDKYDKFFDAKAVEDKILHGDEKQLPARGSAFARFIEYQKQKGSENNG